jgi:hypothetical protein
MSRLETMAGTTGDPPRRLLLDFRSGDDVVLGASAWERHVERWAVTVTADDGTPVGYVHVIILNLGGGLEVADLTDPATGTWREPVARSGAGAGGVLGEHVLVLDRVYIEPAQRGSRLGPLVAALAIARLRRGCDVAVCFPAPFDGPRAEADRDDAITALGRIWRTVGFRPRPDGVWVLDLADDTLRLATDRLVTSGPAADR